MIPLRYISALAILIFVLLLAFGPLLIPRGRGRQLLVPIGRMIGIGMFIGLMLATAGGAIYPPLWKVGVPLACDGPTSFQSQAYSYKPGQSGVSRSVTCMNPVDGSSQEITGTLVALSTLIYGSALSVLLLLFGIPRALAKRHRNGTATVRAAPPGRTDIDELVQRLQQRPGTTTRSYVTVNGQPVDVEVASDVSQLLQSIAKSNPQVLTSDSNEHDIQAIFSKIASSQRRTASNPEILDEQLRQLKRLYDQRLITDAEYASKKADLLSQL